MSVTLSPRVALVVLVAALLVVTVGSVATAEFAGDDERVDPETQYVTLEDGTVLWPYHSQTPDHATRTLPLNVVVYGDPAATERLLREGSAGEWEELSEARQDINPDEVPSAVNRTARWGRTSGGSRYVYFEPEGGTAPRWTDADYQLHDGDYLGSRHHIRAYADPSGDNWTVMQVHREHWDWFRLRHTVHSVTDSQDYVEEQFLGRWYVTDVRREHFGNDASSDADGWVTVVELPDWLSLTPVFLLVGSVGATVRRSELVSEADTTAARSALLAGAIVASYLFVRFAAVAVERAFPWLDPKLVIVLFHPLLVVGVPVTAYLAARSLDVVRAFSVAAVATLVALFFDYTLLGVHALPLNVFLYNVAVATAVGFIAAGASRSARRPDGDLGHVRTGVLLWLGVGLLPLFRFVYPLW